MCVCVGGRGVEGALGKSSASDVYHFELLCGIFDRVILAQIVSTCP